MNKTTTTQARAATRPVVRMIAKREVITRLRAKSFKIVTILSLVGLVLAGGVAKWANGDSEPITIGLTNANLALAPALTQTAKALDLDLTTVPSTEKDGRTKLEDETLAALALGPPDNLTVVVKETADNQVEAAFNVVVQQAILNTQIAQLGGDPAKVNEAITKAAITIDTLHGSKKFDGERLALGFIAGILIYGALMIAGQSIAQGVVEEKTSRVVELLLATVKPWQLMSGKILGIGLVSLLQMVILAGGGAISSLAFGFLTIPGSSVIGAAVWLVVWFALGFTMYAVVFAGLGALVSRQEDTGSVVSPVMMFLVAGYVLGVTILPSDPDNQFVAIVSVIPLFSPLLMPIRLAMGNVPIWQTALALALIVAVIPLLTAVSARIYRNSVVRSGARVSLKDALRSA